MKPSLYLAAAFALASTAALAQAPGQQPQPMTATEALLGRCVADSAVYRDGAQKALADARGEAAKLAAYWAAYIKPAAPVSEAKPTPSPVSPATKPDVPRSAIMPPRPPHGSAAPR